MASRRKSTTPCMVLPSSNVMEEQDADMQVGEGKDGAESAAEGLTDTAVVSTDPETGGEGFYSSSTCCSHLFS